MKIIFAGLFVLSVFFKGDDSAANLANPAVLSAAAKFRRLASMKESSESPPSR